MGTGVPTQCTRMASTFLPSFDSKSVISKFPRCINPSSNPRRVPLKNISPLRLTPSKFSHTLSPFSTSGELNSVRYQKLRSYFALSTLYALSAKFGSGSSPSNTYEPNTVPGTVALTQSLVSYRVVIISEGCSISA